MEWSEVFETELQYLRCLDPTSWKGKVSYESRTLLVLGGNVSDQQSFDSVLQNPVDTDWRWDESCGMLKDGSGSPHYEG